MKNKPRKELHPHLRFALTYFIWVLCLIFNLSLSLMQFSAWEAVPTKETLPLLNLGKILLSFNASIILFQFFIALLLDKFSPKRMINLLILLYAIEALILSFSTTHAQFWIGAFIMGFGKTVAIVNILKIVSNWFLPKQFATMLAWIVFVLVIGAIIDQQLTNHLIENFSRSSFMFNYGLISIVFAIIFFIFLRDSQIGMQYKIIPPPKHFALMKSVRKALKKRENYAIAIFVGLAISQWFAFYGIWRLNFYKALYGSTVQSLGFLNLIALLGFGIGGLFFLYPASYLNKRKTLLVIGASLTLILPLCSIFIPVIPFPLHCTLDFLMTLAVSSATLGDSLIREKNIPAFTGIMIGTIAISVAIFRSIFESFKRAPSYIVEPYQYTLTSFVLTKENHGKQVYEE